MSRVMSGTTEPTEPGSTGLDGRGRLRGSLTLDGAYAPGSCNIGEAEIARRRRAAIVGTLATTGIYAGLVATGAPRPLRLVVALPAAATAVTWLQVALRFCVAFGSRGVYNFGSVDDELGRVSNGTAREADLRRVRAMLGAGAGAGAVVGVIAALIP